ncbi:MAG: protease HtpX [Bdellovibrionaceae bacterium]|nr:protease HtpX [Pseudobdellovibrionaceae bacterium]
MQFIKRIGLFILTNALIMLTVGIAWTVLSRVFGFERVGNQMGPLLIWCALLGFSGSLISLLLSKVMAKWMMGLRIIDPSTSDPTLSHLVNRVHSLAQKAGLPNAPEVAIYDSEDVNAFATGPSKSNSLVAVSTGLLQRMSDDEVDGVLGHEIAHIANGDMVTMTLITGVVNTFALFFSRVLANLISSNVDEKARPTVHFIVVIIGDILFTILGSIVVNYYSRKREFRADLGGAKFSSRSNMIAALRRLQNVHGIPNDEKDMLATMKISNNGRTGIMALFMTHPNLDDRIEALERARV